MSVACVCASLLRLTLEFMQAVYQSLLHLGWIDKLLENISTIFIDLYKDQVKGNRVRIQTYRFDQYFEQQVRELEDNTGGFVEEHVPETGEKKDPLVSSDNGGPPPPPVPGLVKGTE